MFEVLVIWIVVSRVPSRTTFGKIKIEPGRSVVISARAAPAMSASAPSAATAPPARAPWIVLMSLLLLGQLRHSCIPPRPPHAHRRSALRNRDHVRLHRRGTTNPLEIGIPDLLQIVRRPKR